MCSVDGSRRAELECSVLEEDWQRGQSYTAQWHSLTPVPDHQRGLIVMDPERSAQHWEARRLLQRFLSGAISKNCPHPKTTRCAHQSISDPSAAVPKVQRGSVHFQKDVGSVTVRPKSSVVETSERTTVVKIAKLSRFLG
ncbi:uncharacterized protein LOC119009991 isoform X2 [Acanthopagrus latus]|nr:uncharacterized protein LOC119009991 isoform X2 [Acanthopagrus latus]XP_036937678.1 uncharacterized protein LOC119009991 isoform X2 [Acanthopagrus latus]